MYTTRIVTSPDIIWNYPSLEKAKSFNGGTPKYSVQLIIPKSSAKTIEEIRKATDAAYKEFIARDELPYSPAYSDFRNPLRDGDIEKAQYPLYANSFFLTASSFSAPDIYDASGKLITNRSVIRPGTCGRVHMQVEAHHFEENFWFSFRLLELQKMKDGGDFLRPVVPFKSAFAAASVGDEIEEIEEVEEIDGDDLLR